MCVCHIITMYLPWNNYINMQSTITLWFEFPSSPARQITNFVHILKITECSFTIGLSVASARKGQWDIRVIICQRGSLGGHAGVSTEFGYITWTPVKPKRLIRPLASKMVKVRQQLFRNCTTSPNWYLIMVLLWFENREWVQT